MKRASGVSNNKPGTDQVFEKKIAAAGTIHCIFSIAIVQIFRNSFSIHFMKYITQFGDNPW